MASPLLIPGAGPWSFSFHLGDVYLPFFIRFLTEVEAKEQVNYMGFRHLSLKKLTGMSCSGSALPVLPDAGFFKLSDVICGFSAL